MAANYTARLPSVLVVLDVAFVAFIAYITPNMHAYRFGSFLLATHSGNCPRIPHGAMFFPQLYPHHRSTHLQDGSMISKSQPHIFRPYGLHAHFSDLPTFLVHATLHVTLIFQLSKVSLWTCSLAVSLSTPTL
jgi:hypothetical protein